MHDHDHDHAPIRDAHAPTVYERRAHAIETLLIDRGIVTADEVRRGIETLDSKTPAQGARVVARAWADPAFKTRLLADAKSAVKELGLDPGASTVLRAVENTNQVHNLIVCTLCSCYPRSLLGVPPDWYKGLGYRSRAVVDPRGVLKEFGLEPGPEVEVRVYDSTADIRYLVIPARPAGTERLTEEELAGLVTRDSMIGVARARTS
ncbi:MAG: nitrile hydratase subunit alpha [Candidatus Latescibacteria bacterium]|nr:nitrile hydratase subunit alpha [Candidatus Latescibacterota bacterium]